jgi:Ca-activated chloride channel family protein
MGPQIGEAPRRASLAAVDTVVALDVSQSMAVRDVEPDRLHAAQRAIEQLAEQLAGGRMGLSLFAASSVSRYPLTADTKVLGAALDTSGRGFKLNPGSSLRAALQGAAALLPTGPAPRPRAIVVISDGEDLSPELPLIDPLRQRNIVVFALGVGTTTGGPIPIYDDKNRLIQYVVNANGTQVTSRLDEGRLAAIAEQGGGTYWRYDGEPSVRALAAALHAIDPGTSTAERGVAPEDRYQLFLGLAVAALLAEWLLDERRAMPRPALRRARPRRRVPAVVGAALLLLASCGPTDPLASDVDAANDLYLREPAAAVERYRALAAARPTSPEIAINLANALAKTGDYDKALVQYSRAIDLAKGSTRAIAFYDRGFALFREGRLLEARGSFVEALRLEPGDREAKFNIEVIDRLLRRIEQSVPGAQSPRAQPSGPPSDQQQPGGSPAPGASAPPGQAAGTPPPGAPATPGGAPPPSVQSALNDFRKDLTVDEALRLLDALKGEQRGIEGLVEGTGVRRGGNVDVPY